MKALVLYGPKEFSLYYDADVYPLYREVKGFEKKLFKLYEHFHFCSIDRWLAAWKDNVEQYDVVIIFDGIRGRDVLEFIRRKNKRIKIKIYYINTMDETDRKAPANYEGFDCDFYTFDPDDAKKFGMKFKHFYYGGADVCLDGIKIINDVFFVGADKERLNSLKRLQIQFKRLGISYKMIITGTPHKFYSKDDKKLLSPPISYDEVIQSVAESRAVLDITKDRQSGITLRPMEAMMLDKKLVTNNPNVKKYDFYNPENIFILQERDIEELPIFLRSAVVPVPNSIKNEYRFEEWSKEFFED